MLTIRGRSLIKLLALFLMIALIVPALFACGNSEDETPTESPTTTATASPTVGPTATPTPTDSSPVKIGYMTAWSGPAAMSGGLVDPIISLIEEQVKKAGGILGGRQIKVIKFDTSGAGPSQAIAGVRKLVLDDKVSVIDFGGVNMPEITTTSDTCDEYKIPFVETTGSLPKINKYTTTIAFNYTRRAALAGNFLTKVAQPKKIAFLCQDDPAPRKSVTFIKEWLQQNNTGIESVSEQYVPIMTTTDYTSYLTKLKYSQPDVVYLTFDVPEPYISIYKQIVELGGWGDIKVFNSSPAGSSAAAIRMPAALGIYTYALWAPGLDFTGAKLFEQSFFDKYGRNPDVNQSYSYNCLWTTIKAVELAGSDDPEKINQASHSGQLQWDSPCGPAIFDTDGIAVLDGYILQVGAGGKLTQVKF